MLFCSEQINDDDADDDDDEMSLSIAVASGLSAACSMHVVRRLCIDSPRGSILWLSTMCAQILGFSRV